MSETPAQIPDLIRRYLSEVEIMQLATSRAEQPWACSVHFAYDDKLNFYWMSTKERRHTKEVIDNNQVAVTIPIRYPDNPLVGISVEGEAEMIDRSEAGEGFKLYADRFGVNDRFRSDYMMGTQPHELFKLTPKLFVLFDEIVFPNASRQEWRLAGNT
jgi:uncharacterized protein YhbP (UPF0306 family)